MNNVATAVVVLLLVAPAVYGVEYTVGDATGWTQGFDYTNWVSGKTFKVGDVLVFNYGGLHGVDKVTESDYNNCATSNALESHDDGNTKIKLTSPGTQYFVCSTAGHCLGGMKLSVTVAGAASPAPPGSSGKKTAPSPPGTSSSEPPPPPPPNDESAASSNLCSLYNIVMTVLASAAVIVCCCY